MGVYACMHMELEPWPVNVQHHQKRDTARERMKVPWQEKKKKKVRFDDKTMVFLPTQAQINNDRVTYHVGCKEA